MAKISHSVLGSAWPSPHFPGRSCSPSAPVRDRPPTPCPWLRWCQGWRFPLMWGRSSDHETCATVSNHSQPSPRAKNQPMALSAKCKASCRRLAKPGLQLPSVNRSSKRPSVIQQMCSSLRPTTEQPAGAWLIRCCRRAFRTCLATLMHLPPLVLETPRALGL